jgi:hypothetical protein
MRMMLAAMLATVGAVASAQGVYRNLSDLPLSRDEWALMDAAGQSLLASGEPVEGATADWSAPSGVTGAVIAEEVGPREDGALCVSMRYTVKRPDAAEPVGANVKRCRINGAWLISAN